MTMIYKLGTRGSPLALKQAQMTQAFLATQDILTEIIPVKTQGDIDKTTPLSELGGKGVFIKELEKTLISGHVDLAVHSLKDITTTLAKGLTLSHYFEAESISDALVVAKGKFELSPDSPLSGLPAGAKIGTGSIRRKALIKQFREDLEVCPIRGNVHTRLATLTDGALDAVILSHAGLLRLEIQDVDSYPLDPKVFIPAPGQGVIAIESRKNDPLSGRLQRLSPTLQTIKSMIELKVLEGIAFNCKIPFGAMATLSEAGSCELRLFLANQELSEFWTPHFEWDEGGDALDGLAEVITLLKRKAKDWGW